MTVSVVIETVFAAPRDRVFRVFADDAAFQAFPGAWPIPGIRRVEHLSGDGTKPGDRMRMHNSDGTTHEERVTAFDPGRLIALGLGPFQSPMRFLVRDGTDTAEFFDGPTGDRTHLRQRFTFEPASPLTAPVVWVLAHLFLARAVARHHGVIAERVEGQM